MGKARAFVRLMTEQFPQSDCQQIALLRAEPDVKLNQHLTLLTNAHCTDLIGFGDKCLVRPAKRK